MAESGNVMIHFRSIIFGEVLYTHFRCGDIVPGGALINIAWHLQAFCRSLLCIFRVGNDLFGRKIRNTMI